MASSSQLLASPKFKKAYFRDEWDDLACLRVLGPDLSILEALAGIPSTVYSAGSSFTSVINPPLWT